MNIEFLLLLIGLVGVWLGAGLVVEHGKNLAKAWNISETFIGLTILSIGTSLPEIFTHIVASLDILKGIDASGVAVGTNIGSDTVQITLVLGIVALLSTVKVEKRILRTDYLVMVGATVLLFFMSMNNYLSRLEGIFLIALYILYVLYIIKGEKLVRDHKKPNKEYIFDFLIMCVGIAVLLYCANLVVGNALFLSERWHISGSLIGVLIIGVSTALPELTTAVRAILKGSPGMSLGTLIGSNITNPLFAMGLGAAISGYVVEPVLVWFDLPFRFVVFIAIYIILGRRMKLDKKLSVVLILLYLAYVVAKLKLGL